MKRTESTEGPLLVDVRAIKGTESGKKVQNATALFGVDEKGEARESFQVLNSMEVTCLSFGVELPA